MKHAMWKLISVVNYIHSHVRSNKEAANKIYKKNIGKHVVEKISRTFIVFNEFNGGTFRSTKLCSHCELHKQTVCFYRCDCYSFFDKRPKVTKLILLTGRNEFSISKNG